MAKTRDRYVVIETASHVFEGLVLEETPTTITILDQDYEDSGRFMYSVDLVPAGHTRRQIMKAQIIYIGG